MKQYRYIKSNAFTSGASTGNPAASIFVDEGCLSPEQMLQIAAEHKGFVMEIWSKEIFLLYGPFTLL